MDDIGAVLADRATSAVPQSIVDQVAAQVLGMILANEITPGQPVSIQELCAALDVSNIPVREALRRLEGRGLVEFRRGRKPQIAPISTADFEDIYRLRALLEGQIAQHSGEHMTPARLAALAETLAEFERIITRGNAFDVYSTHSKFHLLMLPTATAWDRRLLDQLWVASERYIQLYVGAEPRPDVADTIVSAHRTLLEVARGRDDEAIWQSVVEHIEYSRSAIAPTVRAAAGR